MKKVYPIINAIITILYAVLSLFSLGFFVLKIILTLSILTPFALALAYLSMTVGSLCLCSNFLSLALAQKNKFFPLAIVCLIISVANFILVMIL